MAFNLGKPSPGQKYENVHLNRDTCIGNCRLTRQIIVKSQITFNDVEKKVVVFFSP